MLWPLVKKRQGEEPVSTQTEAELFHTTGKIHTTRTSNTVQSLPSQVKNEPVLLSITEQLGVEIPNGEQSGILNPDAPAGTHWLHQDIVLAIEERGSGILVQRLHVVPGRQRWPVIHAATGMPFLNLEEIHLQR